jgi:hypothetical protein
MKDSRIGESLWFLWDIEEPADGSLLFYTEDHVDIEHEVVRKALASAMQREGISYSLGHSFNLIEAGEVTYGYSGTSPLGDQTGLPCDEHGETEDGYILDFVTPATWVKVSSFD